jgi:hypothetical protein
MDIQQEIEAKGLTAPRVTPADIESEIDSEHYFTAEDGATNALPECPRRGEFPALGLLTFCVLVLRNGFAVTGESACASPENFDAEIGRKIARQNAVNKVWPLLGFRLRDKLAVVALEASNQASHDFVPTQGGKLCLRCGASEATGKRRACDDRAAQIDRNAR